MKPESTLIAAVVCALGIFFFIVNSVSYLKYNSLERNGEYATAEVMKTIRKTSDQTGKYANNSSRYFLKYKFENSLAINECSTVGEFSTTPSNQACRITIVTHQITHEEYKSFKRGDIIEIIYLPSSKKTRSMVLEGTFNSSRPLKLNLLLLPLILLTGRRVIRSFC